VSVLVLIPAHDEAGYLGGCLDALLASDPVDRPVTVAVVANACADDTAGIARGFAGRAAARGWQLRVIETPTPGKLNALNLGEAEAGRPAETRVYLDADVTVDPALLPQLVAALDRDAPAYASGTPRVTAPPRGLGRAYARFWARLPFVTDGVPGFGIFAVNAAGRARWGAFPQIISDDTFVRLHFAEAERHRVAAGYAWPLVAGFGNLVRVRRRQDRGVAEIARRFPDLAARATPRPGIGALTGRIRHDPLGFLAYAAVALTVRLRRSGAGQGWARGR